MENEYLLIKCGYEGIEKLVYLSSDKGKVIDKINLKRKRIQEKKDAALAKVGIEDVSDEILMEMVTEDKITYSEYSSIAYADNPKQYCIQKWDGKNFNCCCDELGVELDDETWFY